MKPASLLTLLTMLGCGTVGGVFFAFSTFVMRALLELPPSKGMAAMQQVNRRALTPPFLGVFVGTALLSLLEIVRSLWSWSTPKAGLHLAGALLYLGGVFLLTVFYHVPRNERLGSLDPGSAEGLAYWKRYGKAWLRWNHVRTVAAILAAAFLALG